MLITLSVYDQGLGGGGWGGSQNVPRFHSSSLLTHAEMTPPLFAFSRSSTTCTFLLLCLRELTTFCKRSTYCCKLLVDLCSSCVCKGWCVHSGLCGLNVLIMSFVSAQSLFFFFLNEQLIFNKGKEPDGVWALENGPLLFIAQSE